MANLTTDDETPWRDPSLKLPDDFPIMAVGYDWEVTAGRLPE